MLKRFGSLYAGCVDLDDLGFDATPVNARRLPNERLVTVFEKARAIAGAMDRLGYDTLWLAEHHFQVEGYECIPNILMLAVDLARATRRLRFGCGFNVTPMWHPLRLAEDFASADVLTGGRVRFGVGRGYHTREVETFGAPLRDQAANRELFEEQVELIAKAFDEPAFSHQGKHYTIPPRVPYRGYELESLTLVPRPIHQPVEWWQPIVSGSPAGLDFMVRHGIKGMIGGGAAPGGASAKTVAAWRDAFARAGRETALGTDLIIGFSVYVAPTVEQGIAEATPIFEEHMKMFAPLGFVGGLSEAQIRATADPVQARQANLPTLADAVRANSWLIGPPEQIIAKLRAVEAAYPGLEEINVGLPVGATQQAILDQLELFASKVMPAFI
jgi:alkanesulfonate monooxygenase SsuD/methylene tetrahydromethanopterin reductase-like flavin-dependent oxidoreductase (luciferase family)